MELRNDFVVGVPVEEAWAVLTDVERIAPCMPGAELTEVDGDVYKGIVKVKVGPVTAQYKGKASFQEKDEAGRRCVLKAEGRDTRGQGNANALDHHHLHRRGRQDPGGDRHRSDHHRPGRPVRPGRAGRRELEAHRPVRVLPGDERHRRQRPQDTATATARPPVKR